MVTRRTVSNLSSHLPCGIASPLYGASEVGLISRIPFAPDSVAALLRNVEVKIVDEAGHRLGPNETGEIRIKQNQRMLGYLVNEEATKEAFDDEDFYKSGDIKYYDSEGYLYVVERIKDIIKYHGFKVSPSELETMIGTNEGVKMVCVVGVPVEDKLTDFVTAVIERVSFKFL